VLASTHDFDRHHHAVVFVLYHAAVKNELLDDLWICLWGQHGYSGNCMIVLGDSREKLKRLWQDVENVGTSAATPNALERPPSSFPKGEQFESWPGFWPNVKRWQ
jgi:hypothetical protein